VLQGAPQVAAGPIPGGRLKNELGQRPPARRHAAEGGQHAKQRISLRSTVTRNVDIARDPQRQVLWLAQLQAADRDLFAGSS